MCTNAHLCLNQSAHLFGCWGRRLAFGAILKGTSTLFLNCLPLSCHSANTLGSSVSPRNLPVPVSTNLELQVYTTMPRIFTLGPGLRLREVPLLPRQALYWMSSPPTPALSARCFGGGGGSVCLSVVCLFYHSPQPFFSTPFQVKPLLFQMSLLFTFLLVREEPSGSIWYCFHTTKHRLAQEQWP